MANEFKINKQAIRRTSRELEKEFAKNPVRVPVHADPTLKGLFAPIAAGVSQVATEESANAARDVIEALGLVQF